MKRFLKQVLLPQGRRMRRLRGGIAQGMVMELDLADQSQRFLGLDERELFSVVGDLMARSTCLIDVGANDGYYTMAFLRSRAERVLACEPGPMMDRLLTNARMNGYVVGSRFTTERRFVGLAAEGVTLRELVADLPRPILIKVDIDGGELDLLRSAEGVRSWEDIRWVVETHSRELEEQCMAWFESHGYGASIVDNAKWRVVLRERRPLAHNRWLVAEHHAAT